MAYKNVVFCGPRNHIMVVKRFKSGVVTITQIPRFIEEAFMISSKSSCGRWLGLTSHIDGTRIVIDGYIYRLARDDLGHEAV